MRIGLDAMGGDYAPKAVVEGAILAQKELSNEDTIVLFGRSTDILQILKDNGVDSSLFEIVDADEVIDMHDKPAKAFAKKPNSSMAVGFRYLKEGKIDSFASAGNTGAMLVGTMYSVGVINGIMRPCLAALVPKVDGGVTLLTDVGVNPDAKPEMLVQFAVLGSVYAKTALGMQNPKVGLANIGEEEEKGNAQTQAAHALMKENKSFEFFGNAEPVEIFKNNVDVVVCDGFVGNMLMKHTEALARVFAKRGLVDEYVARFNYEIYGGLPLLGANSIVLIGHGISNAKAIKSMIFQSKNIYETNLIGQLKETLSVN
ncbi:MAG: phosphate acyltransferase PlsX [Bacteroidales bacterium]|jgi:glycerol-3-phosphate acyltransferase PlsX|nr:phosphate acyltransferase PlsX [Bacteroidales bacterium]MBO7224992.1 phosphate acyltransferase PlsX [Bacteroidales bacterium]MEE1113329.1 phosphate acyltransferase PlsX [Bacteroidales bacterium]MEE1143493.1 phosphate acyltransferase PlsX [Bacteroidales bacterium]MEE1226877.1 phosphate acyltransferase PlsX [Bacteroidales bacterium]